MISLYCIALILFTSSLSFVHSFEDTEDVVGSLFKTQVHRVDSGVKRPVRFCQGFEDPAEIDCYMRSDIKSYVCTEPVTFNPCESLERVETFHYDHITHKCVKVNVPACEGQIIRVLTLLQCLIYCHNKDPFALGKSRSMVFKLNQAKPYVPHEKLEDERKKMLKNDNLKKVISKSSVDKNAVKHTVEQVENPTEKLPNNPVVGAVENTSSETVAAAEKSETVINSENENDEEDVFAKTLNGDADLADYLINGEPNLLKREATVKPIKPMTTKNVPSATTIQPIKVPGKKDENADQSIPEIKVNDVLQETENKDSSSSDNEEKKESDSSEVKSEEQKLEITKNENINDKKKETEKTNDENEKVDEVKEKKENSEEKKIPDTKSKSEIKKETLIVDEFNKTDSADKTKDDGFYLWDE